MIYQRLVTFICICAAIFMGAEIGTAQDNPQEGDYFKIVDVSSPEDYLLEVGGLTVMPNGNLAIATRRGDIIVVENPTSSDPYFRTFATGLHEVLGLAFKDGALYCVQRGELTRLKDTNSDGKADVVETVRAWPLSGNYHEYSYGPAIAPDGSFFVSTNVGFRGQHWWQGESLVPWRGWIMRITEEGELQPWATGMRSPAGLNVIDDELFYTENQGDWIGSGGLWHIEKGDFTGHPAGLHWTDTLETPLDMTQQQVYDLVDPRIEQDENGNYIKPENIRNQDQENYMTLFEMEQKLPAFKTPAVWLPHGIMGISNSDIKKIPKGHFGPFEGQLLVGDQGQSKIMRIDLEKVEGTYQGVVFDFRSGFQSGVLRMAWADDGSLFVGETNRGWGSAGKADEGLQRLVWNRQIPFEMKSIRAKPDGFEITFTEPVDREMAEDLASYQVFSFIYKYHPVYGSPQVDPAEGLIKGVKVYDDQKRVRLIVENLRRNYIHHIALPGIRSQEGGQPLLHNSAYYTLNTIPEGEKLSLAEVSQKSSADNQNREGDVEKMDSGQINYESIKPMLTRYTCTACHNVEQRQVGPAFRDVAKRDYTDQRLMELIYEPEPQNWPDYSTPMPPMTHIPEEDVKKIAEWINSLDE